jgi:hypothetical protein
VSESNAIRALDSEIGRLEEARRASQFFIAAERVGAAAGWRERLDAESERHAQCTARPGSQRGRLQLLQSLREAVRAVRESAVSLAAPLRAELSAAAASHDSAMARLAERRNRVDPGALASERDAAAAALRETGAAADRALAEVRSARLAAAAAPREWERASAAMRERQAALGAEFALRAASLAAALSAAASASAPALEAEQERHRRACAHSRDAHAFHRTELELPLAEAHVELTELAEAQARERARRRTLSDYDFTSSARELSAAHFESQACADAIVAFYTEREAVLRANLTALKGKVGGARECEARRIRKLTRDLSAAAIELARLQQCRSA